MYKARLNGGSVLHRGYNDYASLVSCDTGSSYIKKKYFNPSVTYSTRTAPIPESHYASDYLPAPCDKSVTNKIQQILHHYGQNLGGHNGIVFKYDAISDHSRIQQISDHSMEPYNKQVPRNTKTVRFTDQPMNDQLRHMPNYQPLPNGQSRMTNGQPKYLTIVQPREHNSGPGNFSEPRRKGKPLGPCEKLAYENQVKRMLNAMKGNHRVDYMDETGSSQTSSLDPTNDLIRTSCLPHGLGSGTSTKTSLVTEMTRSWLPQGALGHSVTRNIDCPKSSKRSAKYVNRATPCDRNGAVVSYDNIGLLKNIMNSIHTEAAIRSMKTSLYSVGRL
ncbi:hypothetical protein M8J76_000098 [Diaphorina citri]|nr:hypothetical protein M8J75_012993 [Diaphorina citri]KAI5732424.1 hypothetical protein M8J76_000098 [Diaphorina citri]